MSAAPKFNMLPLSEVFASPLNPRKSFDEEKLAELAASVKEKGILEPVLVRPRESETYEVVAGERRFRAAVMAGLTHIPAMVREMDDAELLEVALLENVVRSDISALEEGDAYRALVKDHAYTVEQLVEKTGKSRTVVFQRMKLADLKGVARERLAKGWISASVAELLARLPTDAMQEKALAKLREKCHWKYKVANHDDVDEDINEDNLGKMPFRDAREILDDEFRLVLKDAPFDTKDAELVSDAGACGTCPKRTGANKDAFPDVKADTCLDAVCWKSKVSAQTRALKAEVKQTGKELVKIGRLNDQYDSDKLSAPVAAKFSRTTEKVDGKNTWKDLLGKEAPVVVALDGEHKTHNLVDKKKALELLEAKDPKKAAAVKKALEEPKKDDWQARQREQNRKLDAARLVRTLVRKQGAPHVKTEALALTLLLGSLSREQWDWERALKAVGLPAKLSPDKAKAPQRTLMLVGLAMIHARGAGDDFLMTSLAKLAKLDVKKLQKKAEAAEKGTCFVCGCTEEKACDGGCEWDDAEAQTLCSKCAGDDE